MLIACAEKRVFCLNFVAFYPKVRFPTASPAFWNFTFFEEFVEFYCIMVKYGNSSACSGYLCLIFSVFEYLVCKKYEY